MKLRHAKLIDFTGTVDGFVHPAAFDRAVIELLRSKDKAEVAIIVDRAHSEGLSTFDSVVLVNDHVNLSGDNPLVGPNDAAVGPRFPVVNNIYLNAADTMDQEETWTLGNPLGRVPVVVAAGLRSGQVPDPAQLDFLRSLKVGFYCYNLVPAMLIAAHAGLKVLGLGLPSGQSLSADITACLLR
ncbi:MAG: hypothetical protein K2Y32_17280 [Candidatus Obscuribacterales bacterium]|nr:hypothetical protein [Candidatus Obscuribacterales bacterium]